MLYEMRDYTGKIMKRIFTNKKKKTNVEQKIEVDKLIGLGQDALNELVDNNGNIYQLDSVLGTGVNGTVYKATVQQTNSHQFEQGDEVAIKIQRSSSDKEILASRAREVRVLEKEGTLLGRGTVQRQEISVLPLFPGENFRSVIYDIQDRRTIIDKRNLTSTQKEKLAVSLLNDYHAMQQLGIVHCDIKPDNILLDINSKTVKIIDMGEAFFQVEGTPYEGLEGPGSMYMGPELERQNEQITINSAQTDMYGLAILIASIYADKPYELEAKNLVIKYEENRPLRYREILSDILGEDVKHKEGMPDGLLKIVQHMASIDLALRPKNIALANGAAEYSGTKEIVNSHKRAMTFLEDFVATQLQAILEDQTLAKNFKNAFKEKLNNESLQDLTSLIMALNDLLLDFPKEGKPKIKLEKMISDINKFSEIEARKIQALRSDNLFVYAKKEILGMLSDVANENKIGEGVSFQGNEESLGWNFQGQMSAHSSFERYNEIGKIFITAQHSINSFAKLESIQKSLEELKNSIGTYKDIAQKKKNSLLEKIDKMIVICRKYKVPKRDGKLEIDITEDEPPLARAPFRRR